MVLTRKAILCFGLVIALIATVMMVSPVLADDETPADTPKAESAEDTPEDEPQTEEEKDPFEVPEEATPDELVDYIQQMRKMRPEEPGRRALVEFIRKSRKSIIGAADKILESEDATKAQKSIAVRSKLDGISMLMKTRDPKAFDMLKEFHKQLLDLKRPELARMLEGQILGVELAKSARKIPGSEPLEDMLKKINEYIGDKPDSLGAKLVMRTVSTLSYVDKKEALKFCQKYVKVLAESDDEKIAKNAERLEGIGRRLDLVGHPMKIVGKTLDGEEFNWADYKGKVVLVQFWATWCGPCRGEIPGILKNYENYHDKGFEVVGISLDREFKKLESYIEKESIPWAIIYNGPREEGVERGELPNTTYYGVSGIPEIILVGKDGNVIATGLRGKKITAAIEKIFGPVEEEKPEEGEEGKES